MDNPSKSPTVLSICTGYGGLERGLELAGVKPRVLAYVEREAYAATNLVAKMEEGRLAPAPIWTDVKTFPYEDFRDSVDLMVGGYPCQPFSVAGKRGGSGDPRHLWPHVSWLIHNIRPRAVFFENVDGHVNSGLQEVLADLAATGYRTAWGLFSAREVGAPHLRKRVFVYGEYVADTSGERVQRLWARRLKELAAHVRQDVPMRSSKRTISPQWKTEPLLDRVVDGGRDRVDRIHLLGNGVVPATAARAWRYLNEELRRAKT